MNRLKTLTVNSLLTPVPVGTPNQSTISFPLPGASSTASSTAALQPPPPPPPVKVPPSTTGRRLCCPRLTDHHRRLLLGPIVTAIGSLLLVTMTQCLRQTMTSSPRFHAPFFVVYFTSIWTVVVFPCRLVVKFAKVQGRLSMKETLRESFHDYDGQGLSVTAFKVASKCAAFCLLWTVTSYLYVRSLDYVSLVDCCSLGSVHSNFIYPLSWIILKKNFVPIRIIALILAMTGVILMLHSDLIFGSRGMLGSVLVVASTFCAAAHKVFGDITIDQMALSISFIGLIHLLTMWIPVLLLYLTSVESIHPDAIPWIHLFGAAASAIAFNCLLTFGIALTYPVFLHASFLLAMPFSIVMLMSGESGGGEIPIGGMQLSAYIFFVVAFILNLLPDRIQDFIGNIVHFRLDSSKDCASSSITVTLSDHTTNTSTPRSVIRISPATPGPHNA